MAWSFWWGLLVDGWLPRRLAIFASLIYVGLMAETVIDRVRTVIEAMPVSQAAFAERVGLTPDKLSKSLSGVRRFTSLDLALIAEAGGRTVDWLLTGREPLHAAVAARSRTGSAPEVAGVEAVMERFTAAYEVLSGLRRPLPLPPLPQVRHDLARHVDQGERLAADTLAALRTAGVTSVADLGTGDLAAAIERHLGVDVAVTSLPDALDGLAWQTDAVRLVLMQRTDRWTRQRFTLAHELGHILAHDAQELIVESHIAPGRQKDLTEVRANVFAANLLMPADEVTGACRAAVEPGGTALPDDAFRTLVVRFKVSPSALAARLHRLGLVTAAERDRLRVATTVSCHVLAGAIDDHQAQAARSAADRWPARLVAGLHRAFRDGETTLRPLAHLLAMDVDELYDLLVPDEVPASAVPPAPAVAAEDTADAEEGDLVFQL